MCVSMKNERVSMTALLTKVTDTFRRVIIVKHTWNAKAAKLSPTAVLINRTGVTTMTPINVSLSRRIATRVKVTSSFLVCSPFRLVIRCGLNNTSRDPFLHSDHISMISF